MNLIKYLTLITIILAIGSCKTENTKNSENDSRNTEIDGPDERIEAVCITNGISIRAEPNKNGKWLSRLSLGEKLIYLGESKTDSTDKNNHEYHFVELSDGQKVWAYGYGILINAKPAVIVEETFIYARPDLVTRSEKKLNVMDFIAIVKEKDNWIEIVSSGKKKKGWIENKKVSTKTEDVAFAIMAYKSILNKQGEIVTDKIQGFLEEIPYKDNRFNLYLQKILDQEMENAVENIMEEDDQKELDDEEIDNSYNN